MGISEEKVALRTRYRQERNARYIEHSFEHLADIPEIQNAKIIASYLSYGDEPSTEDLNRKILELGKVLLLPRISGKNLEWVQWSGDQTVLVEKRKIFEPKGEVFTQLEKVEVIIVPALRIDRNGYRLGQGGGYYDRALVHLKAWKIGLVYAGELSSEVLPHESHDVPLDAAATPSIVVRFNR